MSATGIKNLNDDLLVWLTGHLPLMISDVENDYFVEEDYSTEEMNWNRRNLGNFMIDLYTAELCDAKEELAMREHDKYSSFVKKEGKPQTRERKRAKKRVGMRR